MKQFWYKCLLWLGSGWPCVFGTKFTITSKEQTSAWKTFHPTAGCWLEKCCWFSRSQNDHQPATGGSPSMVLHLRTHPSFVEHLFDFIGCMILVFVSVVFTWFSHVYNVNATSSISKLYRESMMLMKLIWSRGASCCQAAQQACGPQCAHVFTRQTVCHTQLNDAERDWI